MAKSTLITAVAFRVGFNMQTKGRATNAEVIYEWLKAELWSKRYGKTIKLALRKLKLPLKLILHPNLRNIRQNQQREKLLRYYRKDYFTNFPTEITWELMSLTHADLAKIKYINYDYWVELSGGTRYALDAVDNIKKGVTIFNQPNRQFFEAAKYLEGHGFFPKLILVATKPGAPLVVLEGHLRLTACLLVPDCLPERLKVFVGYSPQFRQWDNY